MPAGRPAHYRILDVWMNGEFVGKWRFSDNRAHELTYDEAWLSSPQCRPLSLSLPLSQGTHPLKGEAVRAYFDNLLPDSTEIRERLRAKYQAGSTEAFDLLTQIGRDCAGAVQLLPHGEPAPDVKRIEAKPLTEAQAAKLIENAVTAKPFGQDEEDDLRISLAGAQEKTALLWHRNRWHQPLGATPTTHLLKLPLGLVGARKADLRTSVENEWLCSRILQAYGVPVANCHIEHISPYKVLVVERFDRRLIDHRWWARLPQEDFCQATGTPPERKYEAKGGPGIDQILGILRGSEHAEDDRELFLRAQLLFWMLAATDGHAKNFSLFIAPHGRFVLTPLYDVVSAWPVIGRRANQFSWHKVKLAMAVRGENAHYRIAEIRRHHWNETARRCALGESFESSIERILAATAAVIETVSKELPAAFPGSVSDTILKGLRDSAKRLSAMPG